MSVKLHGLRISYYTGKMEAYLRYKEIPFEFVTLNPERMRRLRRETGVAQMPSVELADGRFMTDTTPMIEWFEEAHRAHPVLPDATALRWWRICSRTMRTSGFGDPPCTTAGATLRIARISGASSRMNCWQTYACLVF